MHKVAGDPRRAWLMPSCEARHARDPGRDWRGRQVQRGLLEPVGTSADLRVIKLLS